MIRQALTLLTLMAATTVAGAPLRASADTTEACSTVDVDYAVAANLHLKDTPFGAADGVYPLGGALRLRFAALSNPERREVKMMSYDMNGHFTVVAKVVAWTTRVVTESHTTVSPEECDGAAHGTLRDGTIRWNSKVSGYRSDGTLRCAGSMCGKFGAPPMGVSPLHDRPADVTFSPFTFSRDMKTFTMDYAVVSRSEAPKQTAEVALAGREIGRSCVPATCK